MDTSKLRRFAQNARRTLLDLVENRLQLVLQPNSAARREAPAAVKQLETQIQDSSREQVIDRVAYTWFNRFCALRYMDVNRVNRISVVSPLDGQFQPEILAEAKMGHIDEEMVPAPIQAKVRALLDGTAPSPDPQQEAYRLLVVAACNYWQRAMPFLFEAIADYTELLMPDDLLSGNSILAYTREAMTPDACQDVEAIGWLYQFYISEKKDEVFEGLKKNKKITPENIPAATQLFTPHWIVRYLVENSLGRLWLLNRPNSKLAGQMDYYIAPQEPVTDFLRVAKPEDIKLCDPACGSGHMLTYAFDLLYAIYEEAGADPVEIPEKILTHNLYGIEIDERAAELAGFALTMKARGKQRRFLNKRIQPNICVLRPTKIAPKNLDAYVAEVGHDLFTANLRTLLTQFEEADNFGSLIRPVAMDYAEIRRVLAEKGIGNQLLLEHVHRDVLRVLAQAEYLSQRYQVVVANPPYMAGKGMNGRLGAWVKENYTDVKSDLFSAFMVRNTELALPKGQLGFMSPFVWMFISSYEKLRNLLITQKTITSLVQLEYSGFDGATVPICTFTIENSYAPQFRGGYVRLSDFRGSENQAPRTLEAIKNPKCTWFHRAASSDFQKIPGCPIAYWVSSTLRNSFEKYQSFSDYSDTRIGLITGDNDHYIRQWHEVSIARSGFEYTRSEAKESGKKWFPQSKGGDFRRWYGNNQTLLNWEKDGNELQTTMHASGERTLAHNFNLDKIFLSGISWTKISSGTFGARFQPHGFLFNDASANAFPLKAEYQFPLLAFLCSKLPIEILKALNPTLNFLPGNVASLPIAPNIFLSDTLRANSMALVDYCKADWDSYEVSWEFASFPLLQSDCFLPKLIDSYAQLRTSWLGRVRETQRLEEENNRIFIDIYGLQDELTPDVPVSEITLTCNPHYRYGGNKSEQELEDLLRADTMREYISYAVGCMFGRYSLDKPGLILANQGETLEDYLRQVPEPRFTPDADNVIPLLDGDWFSDDITGRFREFLRLTFGDEHYDENLRFIETSLGKKGKPLPIRDFFLKEFYTDHVKRYKKRPIYWLFSSPKGSFNALIYLHRYRPDTASIVLQYLRDFRSKLVSERDHQAQVSISTSASQGEKTKALKRIEELKKILVELDDFERDTLYPLATHQVVLDLDDGVKVNYLKLGAALKKIPGLEAADE
jgi:type II restriction/modification system DNA methylase subunit YeeA